MKTSFYILLIILFVDTTFSKVIAQGKGSVLCRMHVSSLLNPNNFDAVIANERDHFDEEMRNYIIYRISILEVQASDHDISCGSDRNSQAYIQCKANNTPREYIVWLGSLQAAVAGYRWSQTDFGLYQVKAWRICESSGIFDCNQLRQLGAERSQQLSPFYLGG